MFLRPINVPIHFVQSSENPSTPQALSSRRQAPAQFCDRYNRTVCKHRVTPVLSWSIMDTELISVSFSPLNMCENDLAIAEL